LTTLAHIQGLQIVETQTGTLKPGESRVLEVPIDTATSAEALDFLLASSGPGLDLQLVAPGGQRVTPNQESFLLQGDAAGRLDRYRAWGPAVGTWRVQISNRSTEPRDFAFQAHSLSTEITVTGHTLSDIVDLKTPLAIRAIVNMADHSVGRATATASIESPNGERSVLQLFDDGSEEHGDDNENDGVYSNYFPEYRGTGVYTIEVTAQATEAETVTPEDDEEFVSRPVPSFIRKDRFSVIVTGAPD
jgi:hypothetical protein